MLRSRQGNSKLRVPRFARLRRWCNCPHLCNHTFQPAFHLCALRSRTCSRRKECCSRCLPTIPWSKRRIYDQKLLCSQKLPQIPFWSTVVRFWFDSWSYRIYPQCWPLGKRTRACSPQLLSLFDPCLWPSCSNCWIWCLRLSCRNLEPLKVYLRFWRCGPTMFSHLRAHNIWKWAFVRRAWDRHPLES